MQLNHCYQGDCKDVMRQIMQFGGGGKVQTIITSPPYYGLRDYGVDGQIGLEETPEEYISKLVDVFRLAKDLLSDDGTLWLNIGDSYNGSGKGAMADGSVVAGGKQSTNKGTTIGKFKKTDLIGLKPKDLIGIPWMLAFALRADGWYLRQEVIWAKPNPMPESVTDRCTKSHESLFLLSKSSKYFFNNDSIKEPSVNGDGSPPRGSQANEKPNLGMRNNTRFGGDKYGSNDSVENRTKSGNIYIPTETRNKRSVWMIPTQSCSEAHFAVMPEALVEPCILAGTRSGDIVFDPFMGSGTVAKVAQNLGRKWLGAELNPDYIKIQKNRTQQLGLELESSLQQDLNKAAA